MSGYLSPDWSRPLDLDERARAVPGEAEVRGLFFQSALREAEARSGLKAGRGAYGVLSNYPVRELMEVLAQCARLAHPDVSEREGLRRLGHKVFPAMRGNAAGRFMFSVAGNSLLSAVKLVGKAYAFFSSATAELCDIEEGRAVIELRNAWTFPDSYHVGVFEGAMWAYERDGEVKVRTLSLSSADFELRWR